MILPCGGVVVAFSPHLTTYLTAPAPREVMAVMCETAWRRPRIDSVFISGLAMVGTLRTRTAHSSNAYRAPRPVFVFV